jgi:hypothetical protein
MRTGSKLLTPVRTKMAGRVSVGIATGSKLLTPVRTKMAVTGVFA